MRLTIEEKENPREGAKMGSVKAGGRYYKVWPDKLDELEIGKTYEVETESNEFKGKTYHKIKSAKPVNGTNGSAHASNGSGSAHSKRDPETQARIERQHSQSVAVAAVALAIQGGIVTAPASVKELCGMIDIVTDHFQRDVARVPGRQAATDFVGDAEITVKDEEEGSLQL